MNTRDTAIQEVRAKLIADAATLSLHWQAWFKRTYGKSTYGMSYVEAAPITAIVNDLTENELVRAVNEVEQVRKRVIDADIAELEFLLAKYHSKSFDLHRKKAAEIFNIPESEVTDTQRRVGKQANYFEWYSFKSIGRK
jgi:hypothetical protein